MPDTIAMIASASGKATPTPIPGVGAQVATDLKDTVSSAAQSAGSFLERFPIIISRLLIAGAVLIAGLILLKIGKMIIARIARGRGKKGLAAQHKSETFRSIITSVFSYIMFFLMAMTVLTLFGVDVTSILAAAGVVGIAIAFGAQTLVKDILSGLLIWAERSIEVGDLISVNGMDGNVETITIRTTSIRNYNGNI